MNCLPAPAREGAAGPADGTGSRPPGRKERGMTDRDLQAQIDRIPWYHEFDFGNGLKARSTTPDVAAHSVVWQGIERQLDRIDFRGKAVLDVGCWDGYWSFYAERRGAASVLASDDVGQNWGGGDGLRLAKRLLQSD